MSKALWAAITIGAAVAAAAIHGGTAEASGKAAVFPFELILEDTLEGIPMVSPAERRRLALMTEETVKLLAGSGQYEFADTAPAAAEIEKQSPFFKCNGCEADVAKALGAAFAITGLVQKGSASTANISIAVRSVATGELVRTAGITVLENTDEGWLRGVRRLIQNRLIDGGATR